MWWSLRRMQVQLKHLFKRRADKSESEGKNVVKKQARGDAIRHKQDEARSKTRNREQAQKPWDDNYDQRFSMDLAENTETIFCS